MSKKKTNLKEVSLNLSENFFHKNGSLRRKRSKKASQLNLIAEKMKDENSIHGNPIEEAVKQALQILNKKCCMLVSDFLSEIEILAGAELRKQNVFLSKKELKKMLVHSDIIWMVFKEAAGSKETLCLDSATRTIRIHPNAKSHLSRSYTEKELAFGA